ncbi:MAG: hypothetical protein K2L12_01020 [Clostridia bacterium]|nr:hypothetical protein [Clostridia bacterium]
MKRSVKMLIAAACVTSIVGVGAVSFAKWDPSTIQEASGTLDTGYISLSGFESADLDLGTKKLVPYDQNGEIGDQVKVISTQVKWSVSKDYTITAAIDGESLATGSAYYVKLSDAQITAAPESLDGWTVVSGDTTLTLTSAMQYSATGDTLQSKTGYISLILKSDNANDMNLKDTTVTITLAESNS